MEQLIDLDKSYFIMKQTKPSLALHKKSVQSLLSSLVSPIIGHPN
jgi:hypothetical protein